MTNASSSPPDDFAEIDRHFGRFIARFGGDRKLIEPIAALLSRSIREGHIRFELKDLPLLIEGVESSGLEKMTDALEQSSAFGGPDADTPVVVAGSRSLYLRRYWDYQQGLANAVLRKAARNQAGKTVGSTQEAAIKAALQNHFTIISGGPGTGKTTTVLQILAKFLSQPGGAQLRVALVAPTGKAAARLQELLRRMRESAELDPAVKERIPQDASTIHRLLRPKPESVYFQHNARNRLPIDLIVVDEASMVPLPLMAKLFEALPETARVILLGDQDQLASVEPGAVLADLAEAASIKGGPLQGALVVLSKNFRFGNDNAIFQLASAIRTGNAEEAVKILREANSPELGSSNVPSPTQLRACLENSWVGQYEICLKEKDPARALAALQQFRILCALREGPFGIEQLNSEIESALFKRGLISDPARNYAGKPILVVQNDYQTRLYNGDIGILLPDPRDSSDDLWAWFLGQDNELRRFSPARLPEHQIAYAMTVHKAQGSEFQRVLLILPGRDSPVLTRELIYTGVTRASQRVDVWFDEAVFRTALGRKAIRRSGLRETLTPNSQPMLFSFE